MTIRTPLKDRLTVGEWTEFETRVFNGIGDECVAQGHIVPIFSKRLAIAQLMLDEFDAYFEKGKVQ